MVTKEDYLKAKEIVEKYESDLAKKSKKRKYALEFICGMQDLSTTAKRCNKQCDGCKSRGYQ